MTNQSWHKIREHIDQVPPVQIAEVLDRRSSAKPTRRAGHGRRWALLAVTMALALVAVIAVAVNQTDDTSITSTGPERVPVQNATYTIPGAELISNALVIGDNLWVTAVVEGTPTLTELNLQDASRTRAIELPGEAGVGGMVHAQGSLWLATVDELGTVGTGFVRVDPRSGDVSQFRDLDRAATLATDGNVIWVRGQSLLQTRSAATGELLDQRTDLGFGWVTAHDGQAWTTDREASTIETLNGLTPTKQQQIPGDDLLERPAWFHGRLFVAHGNGLDILDPTTLDHLDRHETAGHPGILASTPDALFAPLDTPSAEPGRVLRYTTESDRPQEWQLPVHESIATLAVANQHTIIVCNTADTCRKYQLTP